MKKFVIAMVLLLLLILFWQLGRLSEKASQAVYASAYNAEEIENGIAIFKIKDRPSCVAQPMEIVWTWTGHVPIIYDYRNEAFFVVSKGIPKCQRVEHEGYQYYVYGMPFQIVFWKWTFLMYKIDVERYIEKTPELERGKS